MRWVHWFDTCCDTRVVGSRARKLKFHIVNIYLIWLLWWFIPPALFSMQIIFVVITFGGGLQAKIASGFSSNLHYFFVFMYVHMCILLSCWFEINIYLSYYYNFIVNPLLYSRKTHTYALPLLYLLMCVMYRPISLQI